MRNEYESILAAARPQAGIVSRTQLRTIGYSDGTISHLIRSHRWLRVLPGVYATFTGTIPIESWWWAACLYGGDQAYLTNQSALQAHKLLPPRLPVMIGIPHHQRFQPTSELAAIRSRAIRPVRDRAPHPPMLALEYAVLDTVNTMQSETEVLGLLSDSCNKYSSLPARLQSALRAIPRQKHRRLVTNLLEEFAEGATTALEIPGKRHVLQAHGLPVGRGQVSGYQNGQHVRRDRVVVEYGLVIEFDGRLGHSEPRERFRDFKRDNWVAATGGNTVRLGWHDVHEQACEAAALIAEILIHRGWPGMITRCGPGCRALRGPLLTG